MEPRSAFWNCKSIHSDEVVRMQQLFLNDIVLDVSNDT